MARQSDNPNEDHLVHNLDQVTGGVYIISTTGGATINNDLMARQSDNPNEDHLVHNLDNNNMATRLGRPNQGQMNNPSNIRVMSGGPNGDIV
jgi:hypothetical protein